MIASERSLYILRAIHERGVINLKEVAVELGTSEATIRRDLEKLEREYVQKYRKHLSNKKIFRIMMAEMKFRKQLIKSTRQ